MSRTLGAKLQGLGQILALPGGLRLKLTESAFCRHDLGICHALAQAGVGPNTVVDVGANMGQFALAARTVWPAAVIHSYEPLPEAVEALRALSSRHPDLKVHECALAAEPGRRTLRVTSNSVSSSLLPLGRQHRERYPQVRECGTVEVEVRTLEQEAVPGWGPAPRLLKLDVQGLELDVLRGGEKILREFAWILLETCAEPMYEGEAPFEPLRAWLAERGFRFAGPVFLHPTPSGAPGQFDALFVNA